MIDVAIVTDVFAHGGTTPEDELAEIFTTLNEWLERPLRLAYAGHFVHEVPNVDLFILDYGGVDYGCESLRTDSVRIALEWAEDHPGALLILWTDLTRREYEYEFEEQFGHLTNVDYRYDGDTIFEQLVERMSRWLDAREKRSDTT